MRHLCTSPMESTDVFCARDTPSCDLCGILQYLNVSILWRSAADKRSELISDGNTFARGHNNAPDVGSFLQRALVLGRQH